GILSPTYAVVKRRRPRSAGPPDTSSGRLNYFSDVQARSHWALNAVTTPFTLADSMSGCLSQIHGIAGAAAVTCLSMLPQSWARWSAGAISALSMALLIGGTFSSGQFELPWSRMFLPLNVGSSIVWPSEKSLIQPTFGQTATFADGLLQYRVYIVLVFTW